MSDAARAERKVLVATPAAMISRREILIFSNPVL